MADYDVLGLFADEHAAVQSLKDLRNLGVSQGAVTVMSSIPLPEVWPGPTWIRQRGALFSILGAALGVGLGLLITMSSYLLYQIVVGQQPLTPIPPTGIVTFETMMLGIMATTFVGFLVINRLPALWRPNYDVKVTEGQTGILVQSGEDLLERIENALALPAPATSSVCRSAGRTIACGTAPLSSLWWRSAWPASCCCSFSLTT